MPKNLTEQLAKMTRRPTRKNPPLTDMEAKEIIMAIRRGVLTTQIDDAMGNAHGTLYSRLGTWAMWRCRCFGEPR